MRRGRRVAAAVLASATLGSACSTPADCTRSVADACATDFVCVAEWPADPTALCAVPGTSLSVQDCGAYHVLDAAHGDTGTTRYYYAIDTGSLQAIVSWDSAHQVEGCQGGPSDLVVSRCSGTATPVVCPTTDAGAGGASSAGGASGAGG